MTIAPHQACYFAHELTRLGEVGELDRLSTTLFDSKVDLNPHQVEAALFAMANPLQKGVILADEVGLGKTIEAGLVLCQKWAERKRKLIVVCPAHIRKQWQAEMVEKFNLPSMVIDRKVWNQLCKQDHANPFDCGKIAIISYGFASRMKEELRAVAFDLVVLDEAHKLRNAYQPSRKGGRAVRWAFELRQKILLTATPLQNTLLELYGLGWIIGDHIFGDKSAFQSHYCKAGGDLLGLRSRLSQICKRTLRRDCAYVNYTKRQAMTHPFRQTEEEKRLHEDVRDFMLRDDSFAFPHRQRHLIEMILFKNLASSPQALAGTLGTMRRRLVDLRDGLTENEQDQFTAALTEDDEIDIESFIDDFDDLEGPFDEIGQPVNARLLADELRHIDNLIARASNISADSKSKSLLSALDAAFSRLSELGAASKALIFTESRKTQAFLAEYLENNRYAGKVILFNGSNSHPAAKRAYERFKSKHAGSDQLTGSKAIDIRSALIEEFRDHGKILLATEAAAEGINLQFCSLVVNYDLPWNPQRIEQRIGRCHRYGQKHDVIVVNFLSQDNIADQRVHDLLQLKFQLFDGLFGASDEVLGAIEDGVDFEKRVLEILKNCRTDAEIESAFDQLQHDLEETISRKMADAQQQLLEYFDADVHERLKIRKEHAKLALDRVGEHFWKLTRWALHDQARFNHDRFELTLDHPPNSIHYPETNLPDANSTDSAIPIGTYRLISAVRDDDDYDQTEAHLLRLSCPLGQWMLDRAKSTPVESALIEFNITGHHRNISMLNSLIGRSGFLSLDKLTIDSDTREEYLLFTAIDDENKNLDQELACRLFDVNTRIINPVEIPHNIQLRLVADSERLRQATTARAFDSGNKRFKQVQAQVNQWADDKIAAAELEFDSIRRELRTARRAADIAETIHGQQEALNRIKMLEAKRRRAHRHIDEVDDEVDLKRSELLLQLRNRCERSISYQNLFTISFQAV